MRWGKFGRGVAPVDAVTAFIQLASRAAFRAACLQGVLVGAVAVAALVAIGMKDETAMPRQTRILMLAPWPLALGAVPTLLLVRRSRRALGVVGGLYGAGAGLVVLGGAPAAVAVGAIAVVGPLGVAVIAALKPMKGGEAWARWGALSAAVGLVAPVVVLAHAATNGAGLLAGLGAMGKAMGFTGPRGPSAPCGLPSCGPSGASLDIVWMSSMVAPLAAALLVSMACAIAGLAVSRVWKPKAVPEV